jgi:hypothetical protein
MTGVTVNSIAGFKDPDEYHTSFPTVITVNLVSLVVLAEFFFPGVIAEFHAAIPFSAVDLLQFLSVNWLQIVGFVLFSVALVIIHELIHVAAHKWNGFDHSYGVTWVWLWKLPNMVPYVVVLDDPLTRSENIMGLLAPLIVLTTVGLVGLLPLFPAIVSYYAKVLLVVNTAGSSGDIYNSVKVARYPPGTLFRNVESNDGIRTFTYEPNK